MKIFHHSPTNKKKSAKNTQQQTKIYLFYSAFYVSLNRRYSTGTTNIGETNRIYTYYQY